MADAPELKPCPFCGGAAYLTNREMPGCAFIVCSGCQAQSDDGSVERVCTAWNARADAQALGHPKVKALVEAAKAQIAASDAYLASRHDRNRDVLAVASLRADEALRAALRELEAGNG